MTEVIKGDFNYGSLEPELASKLEYYATSGKALVRKSQVEFIAKMGEVLSDARKLLASHDKSEGTFVKWATAEFDASSKTIYNYVNAWDRLLCNGWQSYLHWSPTALYHAAAEDVPMVVQKKLVNLPACDLVRASDIKKLIDAAKPKPPEPADDDPPFGDAVEQPVDTKAAEKEAKAKEAADKKAKAKAAKEAERAAAKAAKDKAKADAKAAKEAAKREAMTQDGQVKAIKNMINQHLGKMIRLLDDLHRVKPNRSALNENLKALREVKLW